MEQQINFESEVKSTYDGKNNHVAIVNNEHAQTAKGAGPEHMAYSGAVVSDTVSGLGHYGILFTEDGEVSDRLHMVTADTHSSLLNFDVEQDSGSNLSNLQELETDQEEDTIDTDYNRSHSEEKFNVESLSYELQVGYRILSNMMSASNRCVNKLFMHPVDDSYPETADYYEKIKEPMWMLKMKEKFEKQEYKDLKEFMSDFRLMIENCYRFNGPDNFVSKKAQKLETMMKQKVALLSRDLRDKINGSSSSSSEDDLLTSAGLRRRVRIPNASNDPSQQLLSQLRRDREMQERIDRRQKVEDRKAMELARVQELQEWEDKLLGQDVKELIKTMWELPQIGLFVYLCMESLGLEEEVTQYQLERGLAKPRECSDFKRLMTCLLSTPNQRKSLKDFMPYQVWNAKLAKKLDFFYKVLSDKNGNETQACYTLGLDIRAFKVMGKCNPLMKKQFHQLTFLKRVWILKNYCDFCMETQPYLQKTIDEIEAVRPMDVREVLLGSDGRGYRYINFPMFTGKDIRIYKHAKHQEPSLESLEMEEWSVETGKVSASSSRCSTPVNQKGSWLAETPSTSLRARVLLQTTESKEASPMRDTSRSGSEAPDFANSTPVPQPPSCETPDNSSEVKSKQTSAKKRKRSAPFFSKRKRLKPSNKRMGEGKGTNNKTEDQEEVGDEKVEDDVEEDLRAQNSDIVTSGENVRKSNGYTKSSACDNEMVTVASSMHGKSTKYERKNLSPALSESVVFVTADMESHNVMGVDKDSSAVSSSILRSNSYAICNATSILKDPEGPNCSSSLALHGFKQDNTYPTSEKFDKSDNTTSMEESLLKEETGREDNTNSLNDSNEQTSLGALPLQTTVKLEILKDMALDPDNPIKNMAKSQANGGIIEVVKTKPLSESKKCAVVIKCGNGQNVKAENCDFKMEEKANLNDVTENSGPLKKEEMTDVAKAEVQQEDSDEDELPELGRIELVAESMEEIRQLMNKLSNPEPIKRGKRVYPGVMKPCEEELLVNITRFHDELLKYEKSLINARVGMQTKLRKEVESYIEPIVEEAKGWDSDQSQSSRDSSDNEGYEEKGDTDSHRKFSRNKPKATAALLTSAATKLSAINGEGNEDSTDSFELDISSRGRLRKRRIIPNNTEDTGLKKRKNLQNQETFSSFTTAASPTANSTSITLPTIVQRQPGKPWPSHIVSMLTSGAANSAIKAQLAAQNSKTPGQVVQLVTPGNDGTVRTLHVAGKPNVIISPQNLSAIRFISSTGVVTLPRNKIVSSSSSAQSSHPVIQQLLRTQVRPTLHSTATTVSPSKATVSSNLGLTQKHSVGGNAQLWSSSPSTVKVSLVVTSPSTVSSLSTAVPATKPSLMTVPPAGAVVVTQVSTSVSQGGKQVLDLGSLSITQLQQLMKNQAIQINTGSGNPTTLLLTTGLQQLGTNRASNASTSVGTGTTTHIRFPVNQVKTSGTGASSLLGMITQRPQSAAPQILLNNKLNPLLTITRQGAPQMIRPQGAAVNSSQAIPTQVKSSTGGIVPVAGNSGLSATSRATLVPYSVASDLTSSSQLPSIVSASDMAALSTFPAARIISSLAPSSPIRGATSTSVTGNKPNSSSFTSTTSNPWTVNPEALASKIIKVPFHLSPKKYASNVTVKALLENRGTKKLEDDVDAVCNGQQQIVTTSQTMDSSTSPDGNLLSDLKVTSDSLVNDSVGTNADLLLDSNGTDAINKILQTSKNALVTLEGTQSNIPSSNTGTKATMTGPLSLPLVDTAIQPLTSAPVTISEIILPTMNIKVPSPNTLPSVLHNKNGTTIVQSTKVPIPVASEAKTGNSLSPTTVAPITSAVQSVSVVTTRAQNIANGNLVIVPATSTAFVSAVRLNTGTILAGNNSQPLAGLKNVTLKVSPQGGGSGQFVQGYVTSRGLVIPQTALLQQQQQGSSIVLTNVSQPGNIAQVTPNQVQIQPTSMVAAGNQHPVVNLTGNELRSAALGQQMQPQHAPKLVVAPSSQSSVGVLSQNGNPSLKVMLLNPSAPPSSSTALQVTNQQLQTTTPAIELVKQIASNSQVQTGSQQQITINPSAISPGSNSQNAVQLLNNMVQGSGINQNNSATVSSLPSQNIVNTGVSPQLAAQILALQQNPQLQQQQQQPNIVLTAKSAQSQNKPSVVTLQLNQLGQLFSNLGGTGQLQLSGTAPLQQQQQHVTSIQQQLGTRLAQPNPVLQLAVNQPGGSQATVLTAPQTPQVLRVGGQLSPQLQLTNQSVAQIQPNGNIVIQQQPTILQQQSPNIIIQQPNLSQSVIGQNNIQIQPSQQQQLNSLQQLTKPLTQSVSKNQTLAGTKGQQLPVSNQQQIISTSQPHSLVLSQLQSPNVSVTPHSVNQPQVQFMISPPSNMTQSSLAIGSSSGVASVSKIPVGTLETDRNVNRIIRADPTLFQNNINVAQSSGLSPATDTSCAMIVGSSTINSSTLSSNKPAQVIMPSSAVAGQFLISPVKLAPQNPQANLISPIKFVGEVQTLNAGTILGQSSTQLVVNSQQLSNPGQAVSVKPAVIYAGQSIAVAEKKEGKIAQILLGQPILNPSQSQVVISNYQTSGHKLTVTQAPSGTVASTKLGNDSHTLLYKIGDQYFTPASCTSGANIQQLISPAQMSPSVITIPGGGCANSKTDVKLLVPPAFIEASDQILKPNTKSTTLQMNGSQISSVAVISSTGPAPSSIVSTGSQNPIQKGNQPSPEIKDVGSISTTQPQGSANGIHQAATQFSFSLSGPVTLSNKLPVPSSNASENAAVLNARVSVSAISQQINGTGLTHVLSGSHIQTSHLTSAIDSAVGITRNKMAPRRNTFIGSKDLPGIQKSLVSQEHLSVDESVLAEEDQDEKEAALNLLTLANQQL